MSFQRKVHSVNSLHCFDVTDASAQIVGSTLTSSSEYSVALESRRKKTVNTEALMNMIETVLDNNVFTFNSKSYHQTEGVAIGSRQGRNYACTYMRSWDEELARFPLQPFLYKRFIDDGFGIWEHGKEALEQFSSMPIVFTRTSKWN